MTDDDALHQNKNAAAADQWEEGSLISIVSRSGSKRHRRWEEEEEEAV
jgi:hypothetical protein